MWVIVGLLLASALFAETQETAYYQALLAEEEGNISKSIELFEHALEIDGPYNEEIQEILSAYYDVLEIDKSSISFRFLGDIGIHGFRFSEFGGVEKSVEYGSEIYSSVSVYLDYSHGDWIHSLGVSLWGNYFLTDSLDVLDTNKWSFAPGIMYSLVGKSFLLNVGVDFNFYDEENLKLSFFSYLEKDFLKWDNNRFGFALWGYHKIDALSSVATYLSLRKFNVKGINGYLFLGPRFDSDYIFDYEKWIYDYNTLISERENAMFPPQKPQDNSFIENTSPLKGGVQEYLSDIPTTRYLVKWLGPSLRSRVSYKFKYQLEFESCLNLFYAMVVEGPSKNYESLKKVSGNFGMAFYWSPTILTFYLGLDNIFRHYIDIPEAYQEYYAETNFLWQLKGGIKWNF